VKGWNSKTPKDFLFPAKIPQRITLEKMLEGCDEEMTEPLGVEREPKETLGPLLLQFEYFNMKLSLGVNDVLSRLKPFLKKLPSDHRFAVEIRDKNWLVPQFVPTLRERGVPLALIDQAWMPSRASWFEKFDPITAGGMYVRSLGDRKGIEQQTEVRDKIIVDRRADLTKWVEVPKTAQKRKMQILAFANNQYAGFGPGTIEQFREHRGARRSQQRRSLDQVIESIKIFDWRTPKHARAS
jgi:uncharacterized protein YecE (DUF72 family)